METLVTPKTLEAVLKSHTVLKQLLSTDLSTCTIVHTYRV